MVAPVEHDPGSGVTPYDRLAFGPAEVTRWLVRGERVDELRLLFGAAAHAELTELASAAQRTPRDAPRVWIVPASWVPSCPSGATMVCRRTCSGSMRSTSSSAG
ncbi:MAG: hypothetical protein R3E65_01310 [Steroidobacteraceae bacterium]